MHLISALAAGITGAANGTAELYTRGTSTRATYYTDFEGNSANSSGANIDLDANGGATIYVNSTVTVVVKDSDGETVRTFTDGVTASSIEVISDSFTGTDYDDASSGVNKPIALDAVLDKWDNSAGADDWQVLINSTATNISTALAGLSGMFYNVKDPAYGAEGDGSTDDTAAIQAAIDAATAASGGIIFFPPGTYLITDTLDVDDELVLMGAGSKRSVISIDNASNADAIDIGNSGASDVERYAIKDLGFSCAQANTGDFIDNISTYTDITIKDCY
ncbi:MAG: glycosyl hydrolase family 28-related protein, partial [bacterium]